MSAQDELAEMTLQLHMALAPKVLVHEARSVAAVLLAAGYRKPRTITTIEELEALPVGAILLSKDECPWRIESDVIDGTEPRYEAPDRSYFTTRIFWEQRGPEFTVIHEPSA